MDTVRTLIVEDDVKIAEIQRIFTEKIAHYTVVGIAHTLAEAEEMIEVLEPDLVLLDIFFPDGNGIDLLLKIRATRKKTDVVLITAAKEVEFFQAGLRGGVFDYILKPLVFSRFSATLEKYRTYRNKIKNIDTVDQHDVDRLFGKSRKSAPQQTELPKGIDPITLGKVTEMITGVAPDGISAEKAAAMIGVSRTTSRRYLEYLVSSGLVTADLFYGTLGRPERLYRLKTAS
ncbi:response regulator [Desulforhopalus singaporensis]|uniref:Transcriptional regulatory protein n=1 Tax=Desulforhopalus singaporensis TaxID=91360 RepID=A0A1H0KQY0_9BACT|nr:response regulator [Desulforhopalus singaporensis]SDO58349.1 two-component system, CitB family, response regulator DcuR [Desulforhopalus singaporensis]